MERYNLIKQAINHINEQKRVIGEISDAEHRDMINMYFYGYVQALGDHSGLEEIDRINLLEYAEGLWKTVKLH